MPAASASAGSSAGAAQATTHRQIATHGQVERPTAGRTRRQIRHEPSANAASTNWSGYAAYGQTFNYVWGTWTVPTVNCSWGATGASSVWVGIDGYGTSTVEQLGTRQNCLWGGASYYAWFEMYPQSEQGLPGGYPVHPGDSMSAYVYFRSGTYTFYMADSTAGWTWSNVVGATAPLPANATAEWIVEQPSCFYECSWLANFGSVTFRRAYASGPSGYGSIAAFAHRDPIVLVDGSGNWKAYPTGLTPDSYGSDFTVYYLHS
jgi:hypothetical protein